jgi:CheY-like chemotaxis protein
VRVSPGTDNTLRFEVQDTGIGISEHQREIIFDAFRQADGSTHRKYGGTGLGLTISRDLARLLGGEISVTSTPARGSTFTLTLPLAYEPSTDPRVNPIAAAPVMRARPVRPSAPPSSPRIVEDDSDRIKSDSRLILIVEDDPPFATILRDMAHELGFQCIVTHTANDALAAVATYRPKAILLDMNLPDYSGLGVLDQLKRNPQMRHIPVHVVSVADYSQEALAMGAVGYAVKPVNREQLARALQLLEAKFSQGVRNVLVVEDDERQRESIRQLLQNDEVQITGVRTAADALVRLHETTFDCMVLDLNLPDLSGYELLEKMAQADDVSFPPVIVYTGRSLTSDEEQGLRRFSKSIIIKDARSPERLLDEVTLFLHQVESKLPVERQRMLQVARDRDAALEGRRILVVEDDVRNIFALSSLLEPKGATIQIARNGREAIETLSRDPGVDLVLMDIMMPEMDGITAMREIRKRPQWKKLPIIALTAKAMKDDQEKCLAAGANDYIAKPLDVEKLLSLVRVWMPK